MAPNRYVKNQVRMAYLERICELLDQSGNPAEQLEVTLDVGTAGDSVVAEPKPLRANGTGGRDQPVQMNPDLADR